MDGMALTLYLVFGMVAFGWRTWLQWRRTGDSGLRLHATVGTLQWWAKLAFVLAIVGGVAAPIAGLAGLDPVGVLDESSIQWIGAVIAVVGIGATAAAQWQMGNSWRIGVDTSERTGLVTSGVFGHVRNPIFSAMVVTAVGFTLMVGNVVAIVALVALLVALEVQVRFVEEPYLRSVHGSDYERYAAQAGRFLPRAGRTA